MTSMRDLASGATDERDEKLRRQAAELERLRAEVAAWRKRYEKGEKRDIAFTNSEGEVEPLYTALDTVVNGTPDESLPGGYPFTRGIHPTGYRGKLWTMRQFAGFGSASGAMTTRTHSSPRRFRRWNRVRQRRSRSPPKCSVEVRTF